MTLYLHSQECSTVECHCIYIHKSAALFIVFTFTRVQHCSMSLYLHSQECSTVHCIYIHKSAALLSDIVFTFTRVQHCSMSLYIHSQECSTVQCHCIYIHRGAALFSVIDSVWRAEAVSTATDSQDNQVTRDCFGTNDFSLLELSNPLSSPSPIYHHPTK